MKLKYGLDDRPPFLETLAYGLQWLALTIPALVIIGQVVAGVHFAEIQEQILYLQKLCFITGLLLIAQVLWGHGMPLVIGPSTVLLIGILSSQGSSLDSIYSAIFLGGVVLAVLAYSGLFSLVQGLLPPGGGGNPAADSFYYVSYHNEADHWGRYGSPYLQYPLYPAGSMYLICG